MKKRNRIRLHNAVFYAYHGNEDEERYLGGKYHVDLEVELNFQDAALHDRLEETVNYEFLYSVVKEVITGHKFYLIEAIAERIADTVMEKFPVIRAILVRVRKPGAPIKGVVDYVEAEVSHERDE